VLSLILIYGKIRTAQYVVPENILNLEYSISGCLVFFEDPNVISYCYVSKDKTPIPFASCPGAKSLVLFSLSGVLGSNLEFGRADMTIPPMVDRQLQPLTVRLTW
jgi:hypothetical protein